MLTTSWETLGSAKVPVLRRVTTTSLLPSGFLTRSCTMRPPTFPVAPRTIAVYCVFTSAAALVTSHPRNQKIHRCNPSGRYYCPARSLLRVGVGIPDFVPLPACFRVGDHSRPDGTPNG